MKNTINKIESATKSVQAKAKEKGLKLHDPFADLNQVYRQMTSHVQSFERVRR